MCRWIEDAEIVDNRKKPHVVEIECLISHDVACCVATNYTIANSTSLLIVRIFTQFYTSPFFPLFALQQFFNIRILHLYCFSITIFSLLSYEILSKK